MGLIQTWTIKNNISKCLEMCKLVQSNIQLDATMDFINLEGTVSKSNKNLYHFEILVKEYLWQNWYGKTIPRIIHVHGVWENLQHKASSVYGFSLGNIPNKTIN